MISFFLHFFALVFEFHLLSKNSLKNELDSIYIIYIDIELILMID